VYALHNLWFNAKDDIICAHETYHEDVCADIGKLMYEGHIILLLDDDTLFFRNPFTEAMCTT
jgi:hypothetical protein